MPYIEVPSLGRIEVPEDFQSWDEAKKQAFVIGGAGGTKMKGLLGNAGGPSEETEAPVSAEEVSTGEQLKNLGKGLADVALSGGLSGWVGSDFARPVTKGETATAEWEIPLDILKQRIGQLYNGLRALYDPVADVADDVVIGAVDGFLDITGAVGFLDSQPNDWGLKDGDQIPESRAEQVRNQSDFQRKSNDIVERDGKYYYSEQGGGLVKETTEIATEIGVMLTGMGLAYKSASALPKIFKAFKDGEIKSAVGLRDFIFGFVKGGKKKVVEAAKKGYEKSVERRKLRDVFEPTAANVANSTKMTRGVAKTRNAIGKTVNVIDKVVEKLGPTAAQISQKVAAEVAPRLGQAFATIAPSTVTPLTIGGALYTEYLVAQKLSNNLLKDWNKDDGTSEGVLSEEDREATSKWFGINAVFTASGARLIEKSFGTKGGAIGKILRLVAAEIGSLGITVAGLSAESKQAIIDNIAALFSRKARQLLASGELEGEERKQIIDMIGESVGNDDDVQLNRGGLLGSPQRQMQRRPQRQSTPMYRARGLLG